MTPEVYGESYRRGFEVTIRFLRSRGAPSRDCAEEAAQAGWARGWERLNQLRDDAMVVSWVNTIALNVYRGGIRSACANGAPAEVAGETGVDLAAIDATRILTLCRPRDRTLFLQQLRGLTTEEIALEQGVTRTAIRIRLLRARREARSRVEKRATERLESYQASIACSSIAC